MPQAIALNLMRALHSSIPFKVWAAETRQREQQRQLFVTRSIWYCIKYPRCAADLHRLCRHDADSDFVVAIRAHDEAAIRADCEAGDDAAEVPHEQLRRLQIPSLSMPLV